MESRGFFLLASLCCFVLCEVSSNSFSKDKIEEITEITDTNSDQEWSNEESSSSRLEQTVWKREVSASSHEIDANKAGCSRYCIQKTADREIDSVKRINIIWKIEDESRVTFSEGEPSSDLGITEYFPHEENILRKPTIISLDTTENVTDDDPKCEIYLQLGCGNSRLNSSTYIIPDEFSDSEDKKNLVEVNLVDGYTEREFKVDEMEELRILATGKISQAILEIPIASRAGDITDARKPRPRLSLSRTRDEKGVSLDARNPPPGAWRLKLFGVENSNYNLSVEATSTETIVKKLNMDVFATTQSHRKYVAKLNGKLSTPQRLDYLKTNDNDTATQLIKSNDQQIHSRFLPPREESADEVRISPPKESVARANLEAEMMESQMDDKVIFPKASAEESPEIAKVVEDSELEELSRSASGEIPTRSRKTVVDLSPNAQLIARPGYHDVVFTVTNNQALGIRHAFQGRSTLFPVVAVLPFNVLWIRAGETMDVAVRILVPNTQDTSPSVVTLYVGGNENFEVVEKSTYIYAQGSSQLPTTDTDSPSISYSFNDNCSGKLNRDRCSRSLWSVDITVKDPDSGLKTVTSLPKGVEPRTEFIAGTKNAVTLYYVSTCCHTTVDIKAVDIQGNVNTRTLDVTDWDNLTQGEIAAIVVGALLILLLIILIIILIIFCVRKRKSHDLSYSQRYGSRRPASPERTNF